MSKDGRYRNWTFIVYPDSAPEGWKNYLRTSGVPGYISPCHDADHNPDGTAKKPHWHVVLAYRSLHPEKDAQEISDAISGVRVQHVKDLRSMTRYLCHLDNPEKAPYSPSDVISFGGADYLTAVASAADTDAVLGEIIQWVEQTDCVSFRQLAMYASAHKPAWFRVISSSRTLFISKYLQSKSWEEEKLDERYTDKTKPRPVLGAVIPAGDSRDSGEGDPCRS